MPRWGRIAAGVLATVLVLSGLQFAVSVSPPARESEITPADRGLDYEEVRFETEDGLTLAGWFVPAENETDQTILVGHGYPYDKGNVLPGTLFLQERYNLLYVDHRSFGDSEGPVTTVGLDEPRDVRAAVDHLEARNDTEAIGAWGISLSAATILMAEDPAIEAIVADSSYASLDRMIEAQYGYLPGPLKLPFVWTTEIYARLVFGAWPSEASPADAIEGTDAQVLLIHGAEDETVDPEQSRELYERAPDGRAELWIVDGAAHGRTHGTAGQAYEDRVLGFFGEALG